jgi:flagellin FlaB
MGIRMKKISKILRRNDVGSVGVGALIIFIAMVLVAGIAASVLVQVANTLQMQALYTGFETIDEVATGIGVVDIEGHVTDSEDGIDLLTLSVRGRAGSADIDLSETVIEIANNESKLILRWDNNSIALQPNETGIFNTTTQAGADLNASVWPGAANRFGVLVIEDADFSCRLSTPIINKGDLVMLCINTSLAFAPGLPPRMDIWGAVIPEIGSWGIISFRTPPTYNDYVYDLQ